MYSKVFKRILDFIISLLSIIILSPLFVLLIIVGAFSMGGNPFFVQERPGYQEKIFKLIKFRTMNFKKGNDGNLLPDLQRLTTYGRFLRNSSLDELPELFNILMGKMSLVGPRPLLVKYLPLYNIEQHHRHDVRPGLTGYAQVHGRNAVTWQERFAFDLHYVQNVTFMNDIKIILQTIITVISHKDVSIGKNVTMEEFKGNN